MLHVWFVLSVFKVILLGFFVGSFDGIGDDVVVTCVGIFVGDFVFLFKIYSIQFNES